MTVSSLCFWHSLCIVFQEDNNIAVSGLSFGGWFMSIHTCVQSINPATEEVGATFDLSSPEDVEQVLTKATGAYRQWRHTSFAERTRLMRTAASCWREQQSRLAQFLGGPGP
jgi:acyl-CoA reductase-like NAD-dependent aldehyde dehydrogenase